MSKVRAWLLNREAGEHSDKKLWEMVRENDDEAKFMLFCQANILEMIIHPGDIAKTSTV